MTTVENPYEKVRRKMVAARIEFLGELAKFNKNDVEKWPAEGEWSPLKLANHLYIADGLALEQLKLVQNEDNPLVVATEEEALRLTNAAEPPVSLNAVLGGMAARREEIFEYLSTLPWWSTGPPAHMRRISSMASASWAIRTFAVRSPCTSAPTATRRRTIPWSW